MIEKLRGHSVDKMLELYEKAPFPDVLKGNLPSTNVLLTHWISAAAKRDNLFQADFHILLAGCGSGAEAIAIGSLFPDAQIVGVDFSENSIQKAKKIEHESGLKNLSFFCADLMQEKDFLGFEPFDLIICHGVADYVSDPEQLFRTFKLCLAKHGVVCMTVNSPNHPAARIRNAFQALGIAPSSFIDSSEQRRLLQLLDKLMANDSGLVGIGNAPKAYLDVDIFAPIAHHNCLKTWHKRANDSGLNFAGSLDAVLGLTQVSDAELPMLFNLGKSALSFWMSELQRRPGIQMLFTNMQIEEPAFTNLDRLFEWKPKLDNCLGVLPPLSGAPDEQKQLTIRFQGLPDFIINTNAYDLEVLRNCSGQHSVSEIISKIPYPLNKESLQATLFRLYHYGLLV